MDQEKVCKQHTNNDSLGVQQGRPEATPDHQKAPLIRTVGRVIYFDGVKGKVLNSVKHSLIAPLKFHPEQARPHGEKEEY